MASNAQVLMFVTLALLIAAQLGIFLWLRSRIGSGAADASAVHFERIDRLVRDEAQRSRDEAANAARLSREEIAGSFSQFAQTMTTQVSNLSNVQSTSLESFGRQVANMVQANEQKMEQLRQLVDSKLATLHEENTRALGQLRTLIDEKLVEVQNNARQGREELSASMGRFGEVLSLQMTQFGDLLKGQFQSVSGELTKQLVALTQGNEERMERMRKTVEERLTRMQDDNNQKIEQMRQTVDEKLHNTLEQRLGDSFKLVSERLEMVHKGLGEMQSLASGVGDLKKVLTNVKTRGTWGEVQLERLLEQLLTVDQYEKNVATRQGANERVEFAIKLPGRDADNTTVWLPIDAKFPLEDYQKLVSAQEHADLPLIEEAGKQLEQRIKAEAKSIRTKYIDPPRTTDFAILFLPIEGLYAEVLRRAGLAEHLQQEYRVSIAGPTTLAAILNSLQMGFRTLAIEQRSSEVWKLLGAVKTEFGKFGDVLEKTKKKLEQVSNSIGEAEVRTRQIQRKLKGVEELPAPDAVALLGSFAEADDPTPDEIVEE